MSDVKKLKILSRQQVETGKHFNDCRRVRQRESLPQYSIVDGGSGRCETTLGCG